MGAARRWVPDGPGSFRHPEGVIAVRDRFGRLWCRRGARWFNSPQNVGGIRWRILMIERGPLTEET